MKIGSKDHIKIKRLKRALGIPLYQAIGVLDTLYQVCASSADDGGIGRYSDEDIALELEWERPPEELIKALVDSGLVDMCEVNRLTVHDWADHAPDFIKDRLRKRAEKSEASRNTPDDSGSSRNSTGNSALTKSSQVNSNQVNSNHASSRSRKRRGALSSLGGDDLTDAGLVLGWFAEAFPDRQSQDAQLFALAASEAARRGDDPPALFFHIVSKDSRDSVRQSDWDRASKRLTKHRNRGAPNATKFLTELTEAITSKDDASHAQDGCQAG